MVDSMVLLPEEPKLTPTLVHRIRVGIQNCPRFSNTSKVRLRKSEMPPKKGTISQGK